MKYEPRWGEVRVGDRIVQPDWVGSLLHLGAIVVAGLGLVGSVYLADVVRLDDVVAFLLCFVPSGVVSLSMVVYFAYRKGRHWFRLYRIRYKVSDE